MGSPCNGSSLLFNITRKTPEILTPVKPTPREKKSLSEIDTQESLRFQTPFILSYKSSPNSDKLKDPVEVIRDALSKSLVYYYPYAGRVRKEISNGRPYVDCNEEGILFIEADADVTLEQLGDRLQPPCQYLEDFLFDVPGSDDIFGTPPLLVQVTRLACGGFIFAVRMNHTISDAVGMGQFLNAVGEMASGATQPSILPVWERHLLDARDPPEVTCTHHEYGEANESHRGSVIATMDQPDLVQRCVYFGPKEVTAARSHLPAAVSKGCTTFDLITACVWKCRTLALDLDPEEVVRVSLVVNARRKNNNFIVPLGYYGNVITFPGVDTTAGLLCENTLEYAVELVREAKAKMDADYIQSCADLMAIRGSPALTLAGNNFILSDNTRTDVGKTDLGWGKPVIGGPAKSVKLISFYVKDNNQVEEDYGILVPICLPWPWWIGLRCSLSAYYLEVIKIKMHINTFLNFNQVEAIYRSGSQLQYFYVRINLPLLDVHHGHMIFVLLA